MATPTFTMPAVNTSTSTSGASTPSNIPGVTSAPVALNYTPANFTPVTKTVAAVTPTLAQDDLAQKKTTVDAATAAMNAQSQAKNTVTTSGVSNTGNVVTNANDPNASFKTANPGLNITQVGGNGYYDNTGNFFEGTFDPTTKKFTPAGATTTTNTNTTTGSTASDTSSTGTSSTTTQTPEQQISANNDKIDTAYNDFNNKVTQIQNGTFPLTPDQQAQIDYIKSTFERAKAAQKIANENFTGGITQAGISSGRNRYAPELAMGEIKNSIDQGIQKIADLDAQAANEVAKMKAAFMKDDYQMISDAYDKFQKLISDKNSTIQKIADSTRQHEEFVLNYNRQLNQDKLAQSEKLAPGIAQSLISIDKNGNIIAPSMTDIATTAKALGVDSSIINEQVNKRLDELHKMNMDDLKTQAEINKPYAIGTDANGHTIYGVYNPKTGTSDPIQFSSEATGGSGQVDPTLLNYAYLAQSTGQVPSGLNYTQGAQVLQIARELPKPDGYLYDVNTGLKPSKLSAEQTDGITSLYSSVKRAQELQDMLKNWSDLGPNTFTQYNSLRQQVLSDLLKAKSGTAVSEPEFNRLSALLPEAKDKYWNVLGTSDTKLKQFVDGVNTDLNTKLDANGIDIAGRLRDGQSATLNDFFQAHPDLQSTINQAQIDNNWTDAETLQWANSQLTKKAFNTVGGDTNTATRLADAIKQVESGGNYNAKGGSGENGAYQFMPSSWSGWAKQYLGDSNAPMTPANQDKVATARITDLLKQGHSPEEVALIWNHGSPERVKGVNKYGVNYDSGAYADKVLKVFNNLA